MVTQQYRNSHSSVALVFHELVFALGLDDGFDICESKVVARLDEHLLVRRESYRSRRGLAIGAIGGYVFKFVLWPVSTNDRVPALSLIAIHNGHYFPFKKASKSTRLNSIAL